MVVVSTVPCELINTTTTFTSALLLASFTKPLTVKVTGVVAGVSTGFVSGLGVVVGVVAGTGVGVAAATGSGVGVGDG